MATHPNRSLTTFFDRRILHPDDPADVRLGKRLFGWLSLMIFPFGLIGVVFGLYGGSPTMAAVGAVCAIAFPLNLIALTRTGRFTIHFSIAMLGVMLVMLAWGILLGGFRTNFSVYWTVFIPLVLVVLAARRTGAVVGWYLVFAVFTLAFSLLDPAVENPANAPTNVAMANTFTVLVTAGLTLLTIYYYKREKNTALHLLGIERERADTLLLNILPEQIAETLKKEAGTIADHYDSASILFADLVGFTPMTARMVPAEMIDLLNTIYSHFDALADTYGVEKIRTIGDNYMVASGVPAPRPDHAHALAGMALDMQAYADSLPQRDGQSIRFRIGIHSGPLVAGVIGKKKFHYDVWGDTVNTASRMESHGVPGRIQVSGETRDLIRDEFVCEPRGIQEIKGKGAMETWFLAGRAPASRGGKE